MSQVVTIKLSRFEKEPWGFRLHGGSDFGAPLLIQKVNVSSLSESAGLQAGDIVLQVNGENIEKFRHKEAQDRILRAGNNFTLTVQRGGILSQALKVNNQPTFQQQQPVSKPTHQSKDWKQVLESDNAAAAGNAEDFTKNFMAQLRGDVPANLPPPQQPTQTITTRTVPEPVGPSQNGHHQTNAGASYSSQENHSVAPAKQPMALHKQYNSPQSLYSEENIEEVLSQQAEMLSNGVKGVKLGEDGGEDQVDGKPVKQGVLSNSHTLRMVREMDNRGPEPEPGIDIEPSQAPSHYKGLCNKNVQSHSFKVLQKALEMGPDVDLEDTYGKVQAPRETGGTFTPRSCASPANTFNRRGESPAAPSPVFNARPAVINQGVGAAKVDPAGSSQRVVEQNKSSVANNRSKFAGSSFQWPPPSQETVTAHPVYINPGPVSRPDDGGQRNFGGASPPATMMANNDMMGSTGGVGGPPQQLQHFQQQKQTTSSSTTSFSSSGMMGNGNMNNGNSQQQQQEDEWKRVLSANPMGGAANAADFTRNFLASSVGLGNNTAPAAPQPQYQHQQQQQQQQPQQQPLPAAGPGQNVSAPKRGRGVLNQQRPGMRVPVCGACDNPIRGPFITALGKTWCPNHFLCNMQSCGRSLQEIGFVEEKGLLYCEDCYGRYLAPDCEKCRQKIIGNCLKAMGKTFHPDCFNCAYCGKLFSNSPFYLEDGLPYCEEDWNELFTTKCVSCGFPIEAGDRWVEALNNNYHSQCFNCTLCKKNLEGQSFFVKAGKPFCKGHARG